PFAEPPAAVLDVSGSALVSEMRLLNGKAVAKGEIHALCAWKGRDSAALQSQEATIAFNQILDVEGLTEDCQCLCTAEPVGFTLAEGEDGGPGKLSATVMLHLRARSEEHTSELQSRFDLVCRLLLEKKNNK